MIRKGKILIYLTLLLPTLVSGQKANIVFEKNTINAGWVQENGGRITCNFKFTNKGKAPLLIKYVETTCGCTAPKWSRRPVMPQDSGTISVVFNPRGRFGTFSKSITVYTNSNPPNIVLKLTGKVVSQPTDMEKEYPFAAGKLRLSTDSLYLSKLKTNHQIINMINTGKKDISIVSIIKPNYIEADYTPLVIKKGMMGNLVIGYTGKKSSQLPPSAKIVIRTNQGESFTLFLVNK